MFLLNQNIITQKLMRKSATRVNIYIYLTIEMFIKLNKAKASFKPKEKFWENSPLLLYSS